MRQIKYNYSELWMNDNCDRAMLVPQPIWADNYNHLIDQLIKHGPIKRVMLSGIDEYSKEKPNEHNVTNVLEFGDWLLKNEQYMPESIELASLRLIHPLDEVDLKRKLAGKCKVKRWGEREIIEETNDTRMC